MYKFEIVKSNGGACVKTGSSRNMDMVCVRIYEAVLELIGEDEDMEAVEASSWAEMNCGTIDDPAIYDMDDYTIYFWED